MTNQEVALFIAPEPNEATSTPKPNYIFGMLLRRQKALLIVNPNGESQDPNFYEAIKSILRLTQIEKVYLSSTCLQMNDDDTDKLASSGPLATQLMHIFTTIKPALITQELHRGVEKNHSTGLNYTEVNITPLLPKDLAELP
ncbi:unnamed protein product, partial [marine sediment metagenome]